VVKAREKAFVQGCRKRGDAFRQWPMKPKLRG
jgi:hypothetical protein